MNTYGINVANSAMDGRQFQYTSTSIESKGKAQQQKANQTIANEAAAEVTQTIEKSEADLEADVKELQRLSDLVTGHKLQFNVNKELNKVIVKVVNSSTDEVIREIPSEDLQRIQIRMKQAIGVLFDEMI